MTSSDAVPQAESSRVASPRRRSFLPRFDLRSLLIVALVLCPLFAWLGNNVRRVRQEDAAIETILRAGGKLYLEMDGEIGRPIDGPSGPGAASAKPLVDRGSDLLLRSFGWRERPRVAMVELRLEQVGDPAAREAAAALGILPEIRTVSFMGPAFDDASLLALNHLPRLEALHLDRTRMTADGLAKVRTAGQIEYLRVKFDRGDVVSGVRGFRSLRRADFAYMRLTKADMATLASLPDLEELDLQGVHLVGTDVLTPLAEAKKLRSLEVVTSKPHSADELQALASMPRLERLLIYVRESDLPLLAPATKLRYLDARIVPEEAGRDFSLTHPECVMRLRGPTLGSIYLLNGERVERPDFEESYGVPGLEHDFDFRPGT